MDKNGMIENPGSPQIKICGLTVVEEALACAQAGADAIGLVFYPPSPRNISAAVARDIGANLPPHICKVGLFVDAPFLEMMKTAQNCRLDYIQLHGCEPPAMVEAIQMAGISVIKALFANKKPFVSEAKDYRSCVFLVEVGSQAAPGGSGLVWQWGAARAFLAGRPTILAGGLNPENVGEAIGQFGAPDAVDVSSGVESAPGRKDIDKVRAFIETVRNTKPGFAPGRIFQ